MKIAFTLCSNNYFAQALLLGQSFLLHNPEFEFYVGLIDEKSEQINYNQFNINILPIAQIESDILDLALKYNIVELNTAVKPHYFLHFIEKFNAKVVFYLDPDIYVYQNFKPLEEYLQVDDILLTPHILKPIPIDGKTPFENDFLNFGLYNLGFIALKVNDNTINMLNWWKKRTYQYGYHNLAKGLFVDQLWINLVPILFGKCKIIDHPGYNIGPWNLHERFLSIKNDSYFVNIDFQLYFYHFSNYNPANPSKIHTVFTRYDFENRPDLVNIYKDYTKLLLNNNFFELKKIPCFYVVWLQNHILNKQRLAYAQLPPHKKVLKKIKNAIPLSFKNFITNGIKG